MTGRPSGRSTTCRASPAYRSRAPTSRVNILQQCRRPLASATHGRHPAGAVASTRWMICRPCSAGLRCRKCRETARACALRSHRPLRVPAFLACVVHADLADRNLDAVGRAAFAAFFFSRRPSTFWIDTDLRSSASLIRRSVLLAPFLLRFQLVVHGAQLSFCPDHRIDPVAPQAAIGLGVFLSSATR